MNSIARKLATSPASVVATPIKQQRIRSFITSALVQNLHSDKAKPQNGFLLANCSSPSNRDAAARAKRSGSHNQQQVRQQSTTKANFLASTGEKQALKPIARIEQIDEEPAPAESAGGRPVSVSNGQKPQQIAAALLQDDKFVERHIGPRQSEINEMLQLLGYKSLDELIDQTIPSEIRLQRPLNLPDSLSENELLVELKQIASQNTAPEWKSFVGLGYYDCCVPPVILRNIFENPGWTTAYTAYQAEIAQGRLESLMNFQTMVSDLTGLDVANASLLDEPTAAAEAMQVCVRVDTKLKRQKFLMSSNCNPQTKAVVETRAKALGIRIDFFDECELLESKQLPKIPINFNNYCGALIQYPNAEGLVVNFDSIAQACHEADCNLVVASDLLACTLFKPPGDFEHSADLVVGSAQRLGVPLNFGGPHAGFLACRQKLIRAIPGRIVGMTRDSEGQPAYRFALQTREQHIRRDKATSNICTAQALLANMSAMYAIYHGPDGLKRIARAIHLKTSLLAHLIRQQPNVELANDGAFFDTLSVRLLGGLAQLEALKARAEEAKINLRFNNKDNQGAEAKQSIPSVSMALDEQTRLVDVMRLANLFTGSASIGNVSKARKPLDRESVERLDSVTTPLDGTLAHLKRKSDFLTHPTFNSYHSEAKLVRYMKSLENKDISLAHSMIPLGSCTMKLNATSQMLASSWPKFTQCHPFQPLEQVRGYLNLFQELNDHLCEITGFDQISFQPNSGAQGEYAGLRVIKAYLESLRKLSKFEEECERNVCLIPVSAHGTNPASAQMAGFQIESVRVLENGNIDMDDFKAKVEKNRNRLACLMITYPSTFGVFEKTIKQMCTLVHEAGGQVYLDGANMNAQVGLCRPGDFGADVSHLNLHKTFCIPHGGGGPGAGPIGVKRHLVPFLPSHPLVPAAIGQVAKSNESFGTVSGSMWGSPAILPISWSYIRMMSRDLKRASEIAILNANYMRCRLEKDFKILYKGTRGNVAHEFIIDCRPFKRSAGIEANDIAKRLQDFGLHAPTVSWPVSNTLMVEPTESEDKRQLDNYCDALLQIRSEIALIESGHWDKLMNPVKQAPHTQHLVCASDWRRPYSREQAAFPAPFVQPTNKIWPTVGRVDDTFGDTNLFCTCPPVNANERVSLP